MTARPPDSLPEEVSTRKRKPPSSPLPPLWAWLLTAFVALLIAGGIIAAIIVLGGSSVPRTGGEPVVIVISAVPSATPQLSELFQPAATATPDTISTQAPAQSVALAGPTLIPTPTITSTPIAIDVNVTVIVVSPGGVNVRGTPGTVSTVNFVANVNETYTIIGGPQVVDGLRWWQIQDARNRSGWLAENDGLSDLIEVFVQ